MFFKSTCSPPFKGTTQPDSTAMDPQPRCCPAFSSRGFQLLFFTNICEFSGRVLLNLAAGVWLYERTRSGLSLGAIGLVQLAIIVPATLYGGVLADSVDRRRLVALCMLVCALSGAALASLCFTQRLHPVHVYIALAATQLASRLEGSARGALIGVVVPPNALARAVSITTVTQQLGQIAAPLMFAAAARAATLSLAFGIAAASYGVATVLPLCISYTTLAAASGAAPKASLAASAATEPVWRAQLRSLAEGLHFIVNHPLLPGLYALDWALTAFTYYRDLFPMFVAVLFTSGRGSLDPRSCVALLTATTHAGGIVGGALTFALNKEPHKGRQVIIATLVYGVFAALFGASHHLALGAAAVFVAGGADSVGMNMRKTTVFVTTPDRLRGRAHAAHTLAANLANALGLIYVSWMASVIGAGKTMLIGGGLTWLCVGVIAVLMPALWRYADDADDEVDDASGKVAPTLPRVKYRAGDEKEEAASDELNELQNENSNK